MNRGEDAYWSAYLDEPPELARYPRGGVVVDLGFGSGTQLSRLRAAGFRAIGLELMREAARAARQLGHPVLIGKAEQLPFRSQGCHGVLCKVVLPYADERQVIGEVGRVLAPNGVAILTFHGLGYSLRYLIWPDEWRHAVYAAKTILNTLVYRLFGRRLPGPLGDTIHQSTGRMRRYYHAVGLLLEGETPSRRFLGQPVFLGHVVRKTE